MKMFNLFEFIALFVVAIGVLIFLIFQIFHSFIRMKNYKKTKDLLTEVGLNKGCTLNMMTKQARIKFMQTKDPLHKEKYCSLLFDKNDYLGWIPNINSKILFSKTKITEYGFEDKFISNIVQRKQNHKAIRKIVFSSHVNNLDRYHKGVDIRNGNFRFIFYGSINEEKIIENYYEKYLEENQTEKRIFAVVQKTL